MTTNTTQHTDMKHTPTPWRMETGTTSSEPFEIYTEQVIAGDEVQCAIAYVHEGSIYNDRDARKANAQLIVKAVNCHDELVSALRSLIPSLETRLSGKSKDCEAFDLLNNARAILARANA